MRRVTSSAALVHLINASAPGIRTYTFQSIDTDHLGSHKNLRSKAAAMMFMAASSWVCSIA
jgi:hypothetical protein